MIRNDATDDSFVSRRGIIRSGAITGLAVIGLSAPATADDEDEKSDNKEEEEADDEEEEADDEKEDDEKEASISIDDHETDGDSVKVEEVSMSEGGFVSIHDRRRFEGKILDSIIGITDFLGAGDHDDVSVPLFTENATAPGPAEGQDEDGLTESQPLIAIPHLDANDSGEFDEDDLAYKNGPKTLDEFPVVNDIATVFVEGDDEDARKDAEDEEEDAREEFSDD